MLLCQIKRLFDFIYLFFCFLFLWKFMYCVLKLPIKKMKTTSFLCRRAWQTHYTIPVWTNNRRPAFCWKWTKRLSYYYYYDDITFQVVKKMCITYQTIYSAHHSVLIKKIEVTVNFRIWVGSPYLCNLDYIRLLTCSSVTLSFYPIHVLFLTTVDCYILQFCYILLVTE